MKLIVGLGNPGEKYEYNRHNAGFLILDELIRDMGDWKDNKDFKSQLLEHGEGDNKVIYLKPQTFMNLSGESVQKAMHFYKLTPKDVTVIHDELDLPFGEIRQKTGGGSAGHNGIESISANIGSDFNRIRIGIRNKLADMSVAERFVLSNFSKEEYERINLLAEDVTKTLDI